VVSKIRRKRIADRIQEELSEMLIMELADPRLSGVSITDVTVDRELAYANIYYSSLEGSERADEINQGFEHAKRFIRHTLAQRIELRTFPQLRFHWDPTFERADRIDALIASIKTESSEHNADETLITDEDEHVE